MPLRLIDSQTPEKGWMLVPAVLEVGQRVFSHYTMKWGTVESLAQSREEQLYQGEPTGTYTTWWFVRADDGSRDMLDDADGNWDMARVVPAAVATRHGYGRDPREGS